MKDNKLSLEQKCTSLIMELWNRIDECKCNVILTCFVISKIHILNLSAFVKQNPLTGFVCVFYLLDIFTIMFNTITCISGSSYISVMTIKINALIFFNIDDNKINISY